MAKPAEAAGDRLTPAPAHLPEALATGEPARSTSATRSWFTPRQKHRGTRPKFMAQPPLLPRGELNFEPGAEHTPVERAIIEAVA